MRRTEILGSCLNMFWHLIIHFKDTSESKK